jgi:membrane protein DedA with SNARE-associated domain
MNLASIAQQVLNLAGTFNPKLLVFLFLICSIGELGVSVPYVLETVWLSSGYNISTGALSPSEFVLLWFVAQSGRQTGSIALYYFGQFGTMPLTKLYRKYFKVGVSEGLFKKNSLPFRLFRGLDFLSPLSIALGRLIGLRIPLTLALGFKRQLRTLLIAVFLSSLIFDGIWISLGVFGGHMSLNPTEMILSSFIALTLLYGVTFAFKRLSKRKLAANDKTNS